MKKEYIKPEIEVIEQRYKEGLMTTISIPAGTGSGTTQGAKPNGTWGDVWADPTTTSTTPSTNNSTWTVN